MQQSLKLNSNFFPIDFQCPKFNIQRIKYSEELLYSLRKEYNEIYSFFRNGSWIYCSQMTNTRIEIGQDCTISTDLDLNENLEIINSLIKHTFFRCFRDKFPKVIPIQFYPFAILSGKDNLIKKYLPPELQDKLGFQKQVNFELRTVSINDQPQIGFLVNYEYKWTFNLNCEKLLEEGFNLEGIDVIFSEEIVGYAHILAPNETLIGSIKSCDKEKRIAIVETNNGEEQYLLNTLFPKKSKRNIGNYLAFKLGSYRAESILKKFKEDDFGRNDAQTVTIKLMR